MEENAFEHDVDPSDSDIAGPSPRKKIKGAFSPRDILIPQTSAKLLQNKRGVLTKRYIDSSDKCSFVSIKDQLQCDTCNKIIKVNSKPLDGDQQKVTIFGDKHEIDGAMKEIEKIEVYPRHLPHTSEIRGSLELTEEENVRILPGKNTGSPKEGERMKERNSDAKVLEEQMEVSQIERGESVLKEEISEVKGNELKEKEAHYSSEPGQLSEEMANIEKRYIMEVDLLRKDKEDTEALSKTEKETTDKVKSELLDAKENLLVKEKAEKQYLLQIKELKDELEDLKCKNTTLRLECDKKDVIYQEETGKIKVGHVKKEEFKLQDDLLKAKEEEISNMRIEYSKRRKIYENVINAMKRKFENLQDKHNELEQKLCLKNDKITNQEKKVTVIKEAMPKLEEDSKQLKKSQETISRLDEEAKKIKDTQQREWAANKEIIARLKEEAEQTKHTQKMERENDKELISRLEEEAKQMKETQQRERTADKEIISRLEKEIKHIKHNHEMKISELKQMRKERHQEMEFLQQVQRESNNWYWQLQKLRRKETSKRNI